MSTTGYLARKTQVADALGSTRQIRLRKRTSNLFRDRPAPGRDGLDVEGLQHVLAVDSARQYVDVEGMTPYDVLVDETLASRVMPCVVPQLRSITVGGAIAGIGIESSSFRHGLVHETLLELDVLLADSSVVTCTPDNEHRDLFFGFANSYGTLGYALRARLQTIPARPYVSLTHHAFTSPRSFFDGLGRFCDSEVDFLEGVVFDPTSLFVTTANFVDHVSNTSDYGFEHIYYRSIRERDEDNLTAHDYLWRWDTDWFWCSRNLWADKPLVRRLLGRERLNSRFYQKLMRWNSHWGMTRRLGRLAGLHQESVIQDVVIPLHNAVGFLEFLVREIGITPIWICPIRRVNASHRFPLFHLEPGTTYVNFGFWDVVRSRKAFPEGHFNRLVENEVARCAGIKSLYSDSFFTRDTFWQHYDGAAYKALKERYDPARRFGDLYDKCVRMTERRH